MDLWLKPDGSISDASDDILPRSQVGELRDLAQLRCDWRQEATAVLDNSRTEALCIVSAAKSEAANILGRAEADARRVLKLGYARGRREALDAWQEESSAARRELNSRFAAWREDLANLVAEATAKLIAETQADAFYTAALRQLDRLAEESSVLEVIVHPDDRATADAALAALGTRWADGTIVRLNVDASLAPGSCICDSPLGCIDAGLATQIAALRRAARRSISSAEPPLPKTNRHSAS